MTKTKWVADTLPFVMGGMCHGFVRDAAGEVVCRVDVDGTEYRHQELCKARMDLIAAAPDLARREHARSMEVDAVRNSTL